MFAPRLCLIPISIVAYESRELGGLIIRQYRVLRIFGLRIAYWTL